MKIEEMRSDIESLSESDCSLSFEAVTVRREEVRAVLEKNCSLFFEGLKELSTAKTAAALAEISKRLGNEEDTKYYTSKEEAVIGELAAVQKRLDSIRDGKMDINLCRGYLHPFLGTVDEMYELIKYSLRDYNYYKPITSLTLGVSYFLQDFRDEYSDSIREAAYPYVCRWLKRFVEILSEDFEELMSDESERYISNDDPDGPEGSFMFLQEIVRDERFEEVLDYTFSLLGENVARIERRCWSFSSPLNILVRRGNMKAFEKLVSYSAVRDLIYAPRKEMDIESYKRWPGGDTGRIGVYPENSIEMLEKLFSMNILIPGTEEAEDAFILTISEFNPSREILMRIKHPSYFRSEYPGEESPLERAYFNNNFSSSNYDLLVESDADINGWDRYAYELKTPLIATALRMGEECTEALLSLGADLYWHDRWGNNILHRLYADEEERRKRNSNWCTADLDEAGRRYPSLACEKNIFGRVPADYSASLPSSFGGLQSISLNSALDKVFLAPGKRRTDCLFYGNYLSDLRGKDFIYLIEDYLEEKRKDIEIVTPKNFAELEAIGRKSEDGKKYAVLIPWLYTLSKDRNHREPLRVVRELLERDNVSVLLCSDASHEKLLEDFTSFEDMNYFVSRIDNEIVSDILLSGSGATSLEKGQFIFRTGNSYFSIKSVPHDLKKAKMTDKKGRIWYS